MFLFQRVGLVELVRLALLLDGRGVAQPDVFELAGEFVLPSRHPSDSGCQTISPQLPAGRGASGLRLRVMSSGARLPSSARAGDVRHDP